MILVNQFGDELRVVVTPELDQALLEKTINSITGLSCTVDITEPNLEDVFIALTQDKSVN